MKLSSVQSLKEELSAVPTLPTAFGRSMGVARDNTRFARRMDSAHVRNPRSSRVALGIAKGKRRGDYLLSARIQVTRGARNLAESIYAQAKGECDVRLVPKVQKRQPPIAFFRGRQRPLEAGLSVSVLVPGVAFSGTLGFIVEDETAYYALSNNHVLANVNDSQPGDPVLQPSTGDGNTSARNMIGVLDRFVPISFQRSNLVDCAVAELFPDMEFWLGWTEAIPGVVSGVREVSVDDLERPVTKAGRTTGVTSGRITSVNVDQLQVNMGTEANPLIAQFSDQIEVIGDNGKPFSLGGDSGSLIVDTTGKAVSLLFAGGEDENGIDITFGNRIENVLNKLGVDLAL